ncbi:MAG: CCA tRNA nucleotidyltransferase [Butyrivibrio sp.]
MKIKLPDDVRYIINKLTENGYEAYAVGGCVRDSILCRVPGDWDITTSAKPEEVKRIFRRTVDTGIVHGTVTVMLGKNGYEVTTYRVDGEYEDGRHPKHVEFTACLEEDLKRRDFTINAMAYNETYGIVDMFGGQEDLARRIIRCVGSPQERFTEDALRMLRAVRFSAQLGFDIEENTCGAISDLAPSMAIISKERIHAELGKILLSDNPDYIYKAYELGITKIVLPVFDTIRDKHTVLAMLKEMPGRLYCRYASLFIENTEKETKEMLRKLKLDNFTVDRASVLIKYHKSDIPEDEVGVRRLISATNADVVGDIFDFEAAFYKIVGDDEKYHAAVRAGGLRDLITDRRDCTSIKDLALKGSDLIEKGISPGREMGEILKKCLELVLEHPEYNTREILLNKMNIE